MKNVAYMSVAEKAIEQIKKGAFLTVKSDSALNVMAIGWALFGFVWRKPIMMVAVRKSRHTFTIIEKASDFTVSIPSTDMHEEIAFCGSKSGRDVDKVEACRLHLAPSREVISPIIKTPGLHVECRIICRTAMDPARLEKDFEELYPAKDHHTLYFGEIVACYDM